MRQRDNLQVLMSFCVVKSQRKYVVVLKKDKNPFKRFISFHNIINILNNMQKISKIMGDL